MKERLLQFLNNRGITSTRLADQIGVQRSSISHIVSGRNKPSYDFIYKFLEHYPQINPKWLILGEGSMYLQQKQSTLAFDDQSPQQGASENPTRNNQQGGQTSQEPAAEKMPPEEEIPPEANTHRSAQITRVIIFYDDHSFEEYRPG